MRRILNDITFTEPSKAMGRRESSARYVSARRLTHLGARRLLIKAGADRSIEVIRVESMIYEPSR